MMYPPCFVMPIFGIRVGVHHYIGSFCVPAATHLGGKDAKMKETKNNASFNRKSRYNPNRCSFVTEDGKLAYIVWDEESKCDITHYYEIGNDGITEELVIMLDEDDHDWELSERYQEENTDYSFRNKQRKHSDDGEENHTDPIEDIVDKQADILSLIFPEDEVTDEAVEKVIAFISTLTEDQQNLVYAHLGSMKQLEEIRREEIKATGKAVTQQAVSNRWRKIITRACKYFDTPVPRKRRGKSEE